MVLHWVWGRVLVYDLSRDKSREVTLDERVLRRLYGGRGLASYLLYRFAGKGVDPLGPGNPLIVSPGVMVGSGVSTASKTILAARSPLTGFAGRSSVGAFLGYQIRRSGFDALIVTGSLEEPGVLVIDRDGARVEKAEWLWGLRVSEAHGALAKRYQGYSSCVIGPAGERLSRIAVVDCNGRQAARTGIGAVMGSKKLKAIVAKGWVSPEPGDPEALKRLVRKWATGVLEHPASRTLVEYGTPAIITLTEEVHGVFPSLNWRESTLEWCGDRGRARERLGFWAPGRRVGRNPCPFCNRVCSQVVEAEVPGEGRVRVDGPEYETVYALGSNVGFCSVEGPAALNYLADEYGLDTISLGATIAWAIEAYERGDLDRELAEGLELRWGDLEALAVLVKKIALREGRLGELLADGVRAAAEKLGRGGEYALHVKGLEPPAYDARGLKGMALGYAVSSRGADHLTSGAYAVELPGKLWVYSGVDARRVEGKGLLVKEMEDLMAVYDITGVCKFSRYMLTPEPLAEIMSALLGASIGADDLLLAGERTVNIERLYNLREGLNPEAHDTLPPRITSEPIRSGPCKGCVTTREELEAMKKEYYLARGWSASGKPTRAKLVALGLEELLEIPVDLADTTI